MSSVAKVRYLYSSKGGSNKVWAAVLEDCGEGRARMVWTWGVRGQALTPRVRDGNDRALEMLFTNRAKEKENEGYVDLGAGDGLGKDDRDRALHNLQLLLATEVPSVLGTEAPAPQPRAKEDRGPGSPVPSHVTLRGAPEWDAVMADPNWGASEKVNGRRAIVVSDGERLYHYNRTGGLMPTLPEQAHELIALGGRWAIDGEAMPWGFVMFDLLLWDGRTDFRDQPYGLRIATLETVLRDAGLISYGAPTVAEARAGAIHKGLLLLTSTFATAKKQALRDGLKAGGGEGVIARYFDGPSVPGDTRHELKFKFLGEIDVAVLEHVVTAGMVAGTFRIGVRRDDGAWIPLGCANNGLTPAAHKAVRQAIRRGEYPVFRLEFLLARTIGISPAEPVVREVRTDKAAEECRADQLVAVLGPDRQAFIDQARPWPADSARWPADFDEEKMP